MTWHAQLFASPIRPMYRKKHDSRFRGTKDVSSCARWKAWRLTLESAYQRCTNDFEALSCLTWIFGASLWNRFWFYLVPQLQVVYASPQNVAGDTTWLSVTWSIWILIDLFWVLTASWKTLKKTSAFPDLQRSCQGVLHVAHFARQLHPGCHWRSLPVQPQGIQKRTCLRGLIQSIWHCLRD